MRISFLSFAFLTAFLGPLLFASEKKIVSTVTAVTVYNDRALVTRTFSDRLPVGTHTLLIPNLPTSLLDNSLRVGGTSEMRARVLDVQIQSVFLDTIPEERVQSLMRQLQQLRDENTEIDNRLGVVRARAMTLDSLVTSYARAFAVGPTTRSPLEEWDRLLQFETRQRTELAGQITGLERDRRVMAGRIQTAESSLRAYTGVIRKSVKQVRITLEVRNEGEISGEVSYVVTDASWSPSYEFRFRVGDTLAAMTFSGEVRQMTGEDWRNVRMTLSTAVPSRGAEAPTPYPWVVEAPRPVTPRFSRPSSTGYGNYMIDQSGRPNEIRGRIIDTESGEPLIGANVLLEGTASGASTDRAGLYSISGVASGTYTLKASSIGYAPVTMQNVQVSGGGSSMVDLRLSSSAVQAREVLIVGEKPLIQRNTTNTVRVATPNEREAVGRSGGIASKSGDSPAPIAVGLGEASKDFTSTSFRIGVPVDIPADNVGHKVTVAAADLPTSFTYVAVPRSSPFVYLTANVINTMSYPLVGGPATVFTDGSYVSSTSLQPTLARDTLSLNVGADESVKANRQLVRRYTEEVGTFSKSMRVSFEVDLTVQSSLLRPVTVEIREPLPRSLDERITVRYIDPPTIASMVDASGILTWKPTVAQDHTETLKLRYSIEYPRDKFVPVME